MPWVNDYIRRDGTKVRGYSRWAAGARREMSTLVLFGVAVAVIGDHPGVEEHAPHQGQDDDVGVGPVGAVRHALPGREKPRQPCCRG